jgi:O-antigen/teichoic acid export membrane protein
MAGALQLMANTIATAGLGIAFWAVAARIFSPATVGRDSALINVLLALSAICQLNMNDALIRFLPTVAPERRARTVAMAYGVSAVAALIGGSIFVVVAPEVSHQLAFLRTDDGLALIFAGSTIVWGVFGLQDAALTAMRRTSWVLAENTTFSIAKIGMLPILFAIGVRHSVFIAWILAPLLLVPVINWLLFTRVLPPDRNRSPAPVAETTAPALGRRLILRFLALDYVAFFLRIGAFAAIPLIVLTRLGAAGNAYFSIPFTLVAALDLLFYNVTTAMTVEGARDLARAGEFARLVIRRFLVLVAPLAALVVIAAPLLLLPYGTTYSHRGAGVLRILAISLIPRAIIYLFEALTRLRARGAPILLTEAGIFTLAAVGAAVLSGPLGVQGAALGWLGANIVVALAVAPKLIGYLREPRALPPHDNHSVS